MPDPIPLPVRAERCEACRFFVEDADYGLGDKAGQCHRGLRHVVTRPDAEETFGGAEGWDWPVHFASDWCGEWKPAGGRLASAVCDRPAWWVIPDEVPPDVLARWNDAADEPGEFFTVGYRWASKLIDGLVRSIPIPRGSGRSDLIGALSARLLRLVTVRSDRIGARRDTLDILGRLDPVDWLRSFKAKPGSQRAKLIEAALATPS